MSEDCHPFLFPCFFPQSPQKSGEMCGSHVISRCQQCDGLEKLVDLEEMFRLWMFTTVSVLRFSSDMGINSVMQSHLFYLYLLDLIFNTSICGYHKHSKGFERITLQSKLVLQIQKLLIYIYIYIAP